MGRLGRSVPREAEEWTRRITGWARFIAVEAETLSNGASARPPKVGVEKPRLEFGKAQRGGRSPPRYPSWTTSVRASAPGQRNP